MKALENKVILVTGAGQGLGAAICDVMAAENANVILTDISSESLGKTAKKIHETGCNAQSYVMDVSNDRDVDEVIQAVVDKFGGIDVVINNAGIDFTKSIEEMTVAEWDRVINVNLRGPFIISKKVFAYLKGRGAGHIVNVVSTASKRAWANASAYHASKWGLLGFSHALHVEARKENIKVTAIIAGGMRTPFILERFPETDPGLLQDPKNVADTIRYVLSQPAETVIPEIMVIPMRETSWP